MSSRAFRDDTRLHQAPTSLFQSITSYNKQLIGIFNRKRDKTAMVNIFSAEETLPSLLPTVDVFFFKMFLFHLKASLLFCAAYMWITDMKTREAVIGSSTASCDSNFTSYCVSTLGQGDLIRYHFKVSKDAGLYYFI